MGQMTSMVVDLKKDKTRIAYGSEQEVEVYTENEVERLLFYIQDQEKVSLRDKLIVLLLLYTGIRERTSIHRLKDLDFLTMQLHVVGKGARFEKFPCGQRWSRRPRNIWPQNAKSTSSRQQYLLLTQRAGKWTDTVNKLLTSMERTWESL